MSELENFEFKADFGSYVDYGDEVRDFIEDTSTKLDDFATNILNAMNETPDEWYTLAGEEEPEEYLEMKPAYAYAQAA
jgi:hypothetical protein